MFIYWATIVFNKTVHGGCLGFTDRIFLHVKGKDKEHAEERVTKHNEYGEIKKVEIREALSQDETKYVYLI